MSVASSLSQEPSVGQSVYEAPAADSGKLLSGVQGPGDRSPQEAALWPGAAGREVDLGERVCGAPLGLAFGALRRQGQLERQGLRLFDIPDLVGTCQKNSQESPVWPCGRVACAGRYSLIACHEHTAELAIVLFSIRELRIHVFMPLISAF